MEAIHTHPRFESRVLINDESWDSYEREDTNRELCQELKAFIESLGYKTKEVLLSGYDAATPKHDDGQINREEFDYFPDHIYVASFEETQDIDSHMNPLTYAVDDLDAEQPTVAVYVKEGLNERHIELDEAKRALCGLFILKI